MTTTTRRRPAPPPARPALRATRRGAIVLAGLLAGGVLGGYRAAAQQAPELDVRAPEDGAVIGGPDVGSLELGVGGEDAAALAGLELRLDGRDVTERAVREDGWLRVPTDGLGDGEHRFEVRADRPFPREELREERVFTLDTTPPTVEVLEPAGPVQPGAPVTLRVRVGDAGAELDGQPVAVAGGVATHTWPSPPAAPATFAAFDAVGNRVEQTVDVQVLLPGDEGAEPIRAVHMSAYSWKDDSLREPVLAMLAEGRINTVEIDLKDEDGLVGYASQVPLAQQVGAVEPYFDLADVVAELHARGGRVIGRLVAFRDPRLAAWATANGQPDMLVQDAGGGVYGAYGGGFTNVAHPRVQQYNIDLAEEAARAGVDDILYDYVRRPEGRLSSMRFPGLQGEDPAPAVVGFLAASRERLEPLGARQGASVFGVAATFPSSVAQPIPEIAQHVDYVAPMVYPSHWAAGEYGLPNPDAQPYEIVAASLPPFTEAVEGTGAEVIPWLQDFTLGVTYGPDQVRAQIDAAASVGIDGFILWDPAVTYTTEALDPR